MSHSPGNTQPKRACSTPPYSTEQLKKADVDDDYEKFDDLRQLVRIKFPKIERHIKLVMDSVDAMKCDATVTNSMLETLWETMAEKRQIVAKQEADIEQLEWEVEDIAKIWRQGRWGQTQLATETEV